MIAERGYATRSEALRDLIREALIQQKIETQNRDSGARQFDAQFTTITREISRRKWAKFSIDFHDNILSVMHLHVSHDDCLEIVALRGIVSEIVELANALLSLKGIKNGKLFLTLPSSVITDQNKL